MRSVVSTWSVSGSKTMVLICDTNQTRGHCLPVVLSKALMDNKCTDSSVRTLAPMRWGLRPEWVRGSAESSNQISPINCRFETITEKKTFSSALKKGRRCVVLVDGFFEWKTNEQKTKDPYFLHLPQKYVDYKKCDWIDNQSQLLDGRQWIGPRLLTMAGLFDLNAETGLSFTIVTVPSHPGLEWLHDRMPAILDSDDSVRDWLDFRNVSTDKAIKLLAPFGGLEYYMVSRLVSNVRNNSIENLVPNKVSAKQKSSQTTIDRWLTKKVDNKSVPEDAKDEKDGPTAAKRAK